MTLGLQNSAPRRAGSVFRMGSFVAFRGLYISLIRCSMSQGLEHRKAGVIVSRQMNPKPR